MLLRIRYNVKDRKTSLSGGASRGNTKSNDESVTDQAGVRAGKEGYDITVKDNAHLRGGLKFQESVENKLKEQRQDEKVQNENTVNQEKAKE